MSTNPFDERRQSRARGSKRRDNDGEPAIWAARHVEWPIPSALSLSNYQTLQRASREAGTQIGIEETTPQNNNAGGEDGDAADNNNNNTSGDKNESSYFGFMSRVLGPTSASENSKEEEPAASGPTSFPPSQFFPNMLSKTQVIFRARD